MANDLFEKRREQMFPQLTPLQIGRLEAHGTRIETREGEVLVEPGDSRRKMLVVLAGKLEIVMPGAFDEVMLLGSRHSADTLRLREFLMRNSFAEIRRRRQRRRAGGAAAL